MKILIIGANAAGMSAASRIKRKQAQSEVVVLEATHEVSYGACGLPFYIGGLNDDLDLVGIRSVSDFEKNGFVMRTGYQVQRIDFTQKIVYGTTDTGKAFGESYDRLLIARHRDQ